MSNQSIKYVGFYNLIENKQARTGSLAAINKMNYLIDCFNKIEKNVHLISPSWYTDTTAPWSKKMEVHVSENFRVTFVPSFPTKNRVLHYFKSFFSQLWLFFYLLYHVRRNEEIFVYHSLSLMFPVFFAKKIKRFKVILEIEEIYTDVLSYGSFIQYFELLFFRTAEKFLFSTELLEEKINVMNKKALVFYGGYRVEEQKQVRFDDNRIHVVYAGNLEPRKGVLCAINAAKYLDEKYHIHIIGFGDVEKICKIIEETQKTTSCRITFDGTLKGEEYIAFLHRCQIGLCTQDKASSYNMTSFPSKVLSYLSNGLRVIAIKIDSLEKSKISNLLYYYDNDNPEAVARVIQKIDICANYDSRRIICNLDDEFIRNLIQLIV